MDHTETLTYYTGHFIDGLAQSGLTDVVISPGSRSTPLSMMATDHADIKEWIIIDERSAAFFALGLAKATKRPVALICTSGTAAANYYPAIVEAYYSRVPLVVLTADRPHELRDVGAPQAIGQLKLYGDYVKWFQEMAQPEATSDMLTYARNKAKRAVHTARSGNAAAVQLNFPLREPLIPDLSLSDKWGSMRTSTVPFALEGKKQLSPDELQTLQAILATAQNGVFVCGPQPEEDVAHAIIQLAKKWNWPVLADPLSQIRTIGKGSDVVIETYDAWLRDPEIRQQLKSDVVIRFGAMPVSKAYKFYVQQQQGARHIIAEPEQGYREPAGLPAQFVYADPEVLCRQLEQADVLLSSSTKWLGKWQQMEHIAKRHLNLAGETLTEGGAVQTLLHTIPDNSALFVGNSMAIRDVDTFLFDQSKSLEILGNRGANGIDGVVSSSLGVAASRKRVTLVLGDLSLFHDMNGLLAAYHYQLDITILVLNNNGGGIFSFLPQAKKAEHFEALFGTPLNLDFKHTAAMYHAHYELAQTRDDLRNELASSYERSGVSIVEVQTTREANADDHRNMWQAIQDEILQR